MKNEYHTTMIEDITKSMIGEHITVSGWIQNIRDHGGVLFLDLRIISSMEAQAFRKALFVATGTVVLLFVLTLQFVFPYLSRFCTKFLTTIKNAALMAIAQFPRAIIMTVITAVAVWLTLLNKYTIYTGIFFWLFIGFSTIALVKARIFIRIFQDIEQNQTELKQKD